MTRRPRRCGGWRRPRAARIRLHFFTCHVIALPLPLSDIGRTAIKAGACKRGENPMPHVNETVVRYIAAWNERDPKRRRDLVAQTWADDGSYIDAHRKGTGHGAIDAMLAAAQAQF